MTPRAIRRTYYAIAGVFTLSASLIWGVNTLFLLDAGLDIFSAFIANGAFTVGNVLFEIPTGVVADTVGRRVSFLLSVSVLCVATLVYFAIPYLDIEPLIPFTITSVFLGLGFTFYSGAVEAWVVDALQASGYDGDLDHVFSRGAMFSAGAMLVGTVGGGLLGQLDLGIPFVARGVALAVAFVIALVGMHDIGFQARPLTLKTWRSELVSVARTGVQYGWSRPTLRLMMLTSFVQTGFIIWGFYAWQPYFLELLDSDAVWVAGLVAAGVAMSTMAGNYLVDWFAKACRKRTTMLLWAAGVQTAAAVGIGLAPTFPVALACLLLTTASMGVIGPVRQAYIHSTVPGTQRATVVSFDSLVGNLGGSIGQPGLGYLARVRDYSTAYIVGGALTVLAIPLYVAIRLKGRDADRIGDKAGKRSACAAQGVACTGAMDDKPRTHIDGETAPG